LAGLYATFDYFVPSALGIAGGPYTEFVLLFEDNLARLAFISDPPDGPKTKGISDRTTPDGSPFITFRVVPEPSSLALTLLGLLAVAIGARVRSRASHHSVLVRA